MTPRPSAPGPTDPPDSPIPGFSRPSLVLFPGSLGDFLCFLPALHSLLSRAGSGQVALAVRGAAFEIAQSLGGLRAVYLLDRGMFAGLFSSSFGDRRREEHFFSSFRSVFSWFGHSHGQVQAKLRRYSQDVYSFPFFIGQDPGQGHSSRYYLDCVGISEIRCPSLPLGSRDWTAGEQYWQTMGWSSRTQMLVIHPGSGGKRKRWESAGFSAVAQWWKHGQAREVIVLLGPAEEAEYQRWRTVGHVIHGSPIWFVATLLGRASLYLGNDSGVSHLAGSVGARGSVIFGPTRPEQWKPLGGSLSIIRNRSYRQSSPDVEGISLSEVPVERVIAALRGAV